MTAYRLLISGNSVASMDAYHKFMKFLAQNNPMGENHWDIGVAWR
jgi:hypothetical protein